MILKLNKKYNITTDENNFTLNEVVIKGEESKNAGEEYNRAIGYYGTLESALKGFVKHGLRKSDKTTDLKGVAVILENMEKEIKKTAKLSWEKYQEDKVSEDADIVKDSKDLPELNKKTQKESKMKTATKTKGEIAKENLDKKSAKSAETVKMVKTTKTQKETK